MVQYVRDKIRWEVHVWIGVWSWILDHLIGPNGDPDAQTFHFTNNSHNESIISLSASDLLIPTSRKSCCLQWHIHVSPELVTMIVLYSRTRFEETLAAPTLMH